MNHPQRTGGPDERLKAGDVARSAGLSVQQVRNYVDQGVLPPVGRTAGNFRVFTRRHAEALSTVRLLIPGHGWKRAFDAMRAANAGDTTAALALVDAGHAELHRERAEIARVLGAFDEITSAPDGRVPAARGSARIGEVAGAVGVRPSALRVWEEHGLLRPAREKGTGYRVFDASEARIAHVVALLRRGGYTLSIVGSVVAEMRSTGSPERVRAELARRERELDRRSMLCLEGSAAFHAYLRDYAPGADLGQDRP